MIILAQNKKKVKNTNIKNNQKQIVSFYILLFFVLYVFGNFWKILANEKISCNFLFLNVSQASNNRENISNKSSKLSESNESINSSNLDSDVVNYTCLSKPLEFRFNYRGPRGRRVSEECEIKLDDRDIKHILVYLLKDCLISDETRLKRVFAWNRRRRELSQIMDLKENPDRLRAEEIEFRKEYEKKLWENIHPSVKELARLYNIKTLQGFRHFAWRIADHSSHVTTNILRSNIRHSPPNVISNYDNISPILTEKLLNSKNKEYNEYGQNKKQLARDMTSHELNVTMKRIQDLEWQQERLKLQRVSQSQLESESQDSDLDEIEQEDENEDDNVDEIESVEIIDDNENENRNGSESEHQFVGGEEDMNDENSTNNNELSAAIAAAKDKRRFRSRSKDIPFEDVLNKISDKWDGDIRRNDDKYIGGDWRVRLGIMQRPPKAFNIENEVETQWETQLQEGFQLTVRKRYKISPFKIRSLPYDERKDIEIDFRNVKFLNNFVNVRGMILPRRLTGINPKHQKKIVRSINRAKKMGFMPPMTKLVILDKKRIFDRREASLISKFKYNEREFYDPLTIDDLEQMYPEYKSKEEDDNDNGDTNIGEDDYIENIRKEELIDFQSLYQVKDSELDYQSKLKDDQTMFMKEIKQDIMKQLPQYWQNRIKFRNEQAKIMEERIERKAQQIEKNKIEREKQRAKEREQENATRDKNRRYRNNQRNQYDNSYEFQFD